MKILVVFFSRSGRTRRVAEMIARQAGADLEAIAPRQGYGGFFGFFRAGSQAVRRRTPAINRLQKNVTAYDLVVLGTPIWAGHISSPLRTAIVEQKDKIKRYAIFCTAGNAEPQSVLNDVQEAIGFTPVAVAVFTAREVSRGSLQEKLDKFVADLSAT